MSSHVPRLNPAVVEPSAEARNFAKQMHQLFVALTNEGFTEKQALTIVGQIIEANGSGS